VKSAAQLEVSIERVKEAILSLGDFVAEAEGIGIFGSLARGDFGPRSDIDIFVVIDDKDDRQDIDDIWCKRINKVLRPFERDVTVLVYTIKALKNVCNWYVLRLASDGILVCDGGRVKPLFAEILDAAEKAGLEQREMAGTMLWAPKRKIKMGEVFEVSVED